MLLFPAMGHWCPVAAESLEGHRLYKRHYSTRRYRDSRRVVRFVGPGSYVVLINSEATALFVWRDFISDDKVYGDGINCSVFRNESRVRSSKLILEAEEYAWRKWPGRRLYTYVDASKVESCNPGYCFMCAGWKKVGKTKGGLLVFEKLPVFSVPSVALW